MARTGKPRPGAWSVLSRALAASACGFVVTNAVTGAASLVPANPMDSFYLVGLFAALTWALAVMWAFAAKSAAWAWAGMLLPSIPLLAIVALARSWP